ncbi:MAG TPA: hypothetical protein PK264_01365, partial [Hyphomicrobiaceae bacterium]|nr:hypothetical protein [Hyphomicrobiaceae bacterium]
MCSLSPGIRAMAWLDISCPQSAASIAWNDPSVVAARHRDRRAGKVLFAVGVEIGYEVREAPIAQLDRASASGAEGQR